MERKHFAAAALLAMVAAATVVADTPPFAYTPSSTLSVVWDDATKTDLVEGASTQVGNYKATDAELVTDGLTSGVRYGRVYAGVNAASVNPATDWLVGTIGPFRFSGTATIDADGDVRTRALLALPAVAPAANGGLATCNGSNQVRALNGTGNAIPDTGDIANLEITLDGIPADTSAALLDAIVGATPTADTVAALLDRIRDSIPAAAPGASGGLARVQDLPEGGGGGVVLPINQIPIPPARTWTLRPTEDGLDGGWLTVRIGETKPFAVDFREDLAANGRLVDFELIEIIYDDEEEAPEEDPLTFDDDLDVDRSQAKFAFDELTAGDYDLRVKVEYDDSDGGGFSIGVIHVHARP